MPLTHDAILQTLSKVLPPDQERDVVSLGMIRDIQLEDDRVTIGIELPTSDESIRTRLQADIEGAIRSAAGTDIPVETVFTTKAPPSGPAGDAPSNPLPGVKHVIAVGAGKGGVGKSTVSTFLATGLARLGARVGLLDGDIYGPSMSTMLGLDEIQATANGNILDPFEVHGIKSMTIAKLVDPEKAMIWRGPMAHKAFSQLVLQTDWGELDYLIVDLPPGTGDVPLSLAQLLPLTGSVVVCTPQRVAIDDARRAVRMFQQLNVNVLGVVENMSWFVGDDGKEYDIFGRGGAEQMAAGMSIPFLGAIPIHMNMRVNADAGTPLANFEINDEITGKLEQTCRNLAEQVSISAMQDPGRPTLTISGSPPPSS